MLALALDTSTPVLSAALVEWDGVTLRVRARREAGPPQVTSTVVPGVFDEMLSEVGARLDDVGALVAGLGPGLFTGTRVAVATMKAVAFARRLPLIGAGSLEAMALASVASTGAITSSSIPDSPLLCPVLDARKGEVYSALYRFTGGLLMTVEAPRAEPPAAMVSRLLSLHEPVHVFGTGVVAIGASMPVADHVVRMATPQTPGAAEIAYFALSRTPAPTFDLQAVLALEPSYLRPPEAEVALRKRQAAVRESGAT